jgi:hypothetical protein
MPFFMSTTAMVVSNCRPSSLAASSRALFGFWVALLRARAQLGLDALADVLQRGVLRLVVGGSLGWLRLLVLGLLRQLVVFLVLVVVLLDVSPGDLDPVVVLAVLDAHVLDILDAAHVGVVEDGSAHLVLGDAQTGLLSHVKPREIGGHEQMGLVLPDVREDHSRHAAEDPPVLAHGDLLAEGIAVDGILALSRRPSAALRADAPGDHEERREEEQHRFLQVAERLKIHRPIPRDRLVSSEQKARQTKTRRIPDYRRGFNAFQVSGWVRTRIVVTLEAASAAPARRMAGV